MIVCQEYKDGVVVKRKKKNFIVVRVGTITHPMTQSVIRMLLDMGYKVSVVTTKNNDDLNNLFHNKIKIREIDVDYTKPANIIVKFFRLFIIRLELWKAINELIDEDSILWVGHNITIKHLGNRLCKYDYILHLNELNENIAYWPRFPIFKLNAEKIGNGAKSVIVPEYNRAYIVQAMWNLKTLPKIMPNKPYLEKSLPKNATINSSKEAKELINKLDGKKIILYQGAISRERKIDSFVRAVSELGDDYAFLIMSKDLNIINFVLPQNCYTLHHINAPEHLEVTSHAFLGVLSYIPEMTSNSKLNSLYCAPNKLFEYSMFQIPMIGNDIPGLRTVFSQYGCGECCSYDEQQIVKVIKLIEDNYSVYCENSKRLYQSVDNYETLRKIVQEIEKE